MVERIVNVLTVLIYTRKKERIEIFHQDHSEYSASIVIERVHAVLVLICIRKKEKKWANRQHHLEYFANME
jgi:hypothetical protein